MADLADQEERSPNGAERQTRAREMVLIPSGFAPVPGQVLDQDRRARWPAPHGDSPGNVADHLHEVSAVLPVFTLIPASSDEYVATAAAWQPEEHRTIVYGGYRLIVSGSMCEEAGGLASLTLLPDARTRPAGE